MVTPSVFMRLGLFLNKEDEGGEDATLSIFRNIYFDNSLMHTATV